MLDFLFVYEHKAREIENICLVKKYLEDNGYSVDLVQYNSNHIFKYLTYRKPKVVIVFALYGDKEIRYHVARIAGNVKKIVNLQSEQIYRNDPKALEAFNPKGFAKEVVWICWGKERQEQLRECGVKKAVNIGPVQMDFLMPRFNRFYKAKDEILKEFNIVSDRVVLYISSFSYATLSEETKQGVSEMFGSESVQDFENLSVNSRKITLNWIANFLEKYPDISFVYRPHPAEQADMILKKYEKKYKNFKVISQYSVKQWILVCDKILTWYSTSTAEVFYAKKNCAIIRPIPIPYDMECSLYNEAQFITKYDEMEQYIIDDFEHEFPISEKTIKKYYDHQGFSYTKLGNLLEEVYKTEEYDITCNIISKTQLLLEVIKSLIKKILVYVPKLHFNVLPQSILNELKVYYETQKRYKKENVTEEELKEILDKINICLEEKR